MSSADNHVKNTQEVYEEYASTTLMSVPRWQHLGGSEKLAWSRAVDRAREPLEAELKRLREKLAHISVALGCM